MLVMDICIVLNLFFVYLMDSLVYLFERDSMRFSVYNLGDGIIASGFEPFYVA